MNHKIITIIILSLFFAGLSLAGDVTISLTGVNPLSVNIKGSSANEQAGGISIYLYFCDDATTELDIANVNDDQLEVTWGWGDFFRTQSIQTGSWVKGGYTFTRRLFYDNAGINSLDDYWTTDGINALVCTFSAVGSGHAFIEVFGFDGLADWTAHAHNITFANQEQALPVELTNFSACCTDKGVLIQWATESETNNLGFVLEKKNQNEADYNIIASYQTHLNLKGKGTSTTRTEYSFTDVNITSGDSCTYRLADVNRNGNKTLLGICKTVVTRAALPQSTCLLPAFPNPFNPETRIRYELHKQAHISITIYDMLGRKVKTLIDENQNAGVYQAIWNGMDNAGAKAASGAYIVRMQTAEVTQTQKVLLLK